MRLGSRHVGQLDPDRRVQEARACPASRLRQGPSPSSLSACTSSRYSARADPAPSALHLAGLPHRRQDALRAVPRILRGVRQLEQGEGRSGEGEGEGGVRKGASAAMSSLRTPSARAAAGPARSFEGWADASFCRPGLQLGPRRSLRRVAPPPADPKPHRDVHHALARADCVVRWARRGERARPRGRQGRGGGDGESTSCLDPCRPRGRPLGR